MTDLTTADPATREREYSPSSLLGGHYQPFVDRYRAESARARAHLPVRRNLRYGPADRACLDFFPVAEPAAPVAPLLVYLHGGYWQELSKDDSAFLAPAWHASGVAHAVVGYTLAPQATLPAIVDECVAALTWLQARAGELGVDAGQVVVAGSSAGAYLAAACAARGAPLAAIVAVSGVYDVAPLIGTSINDALGLDTAMAAELNLLREGLRFRPAVVAWGEVETAAFKRQSAAFVERLQRAGTPYEALEVPGRNHFDVILDLANPATALFAAARRLFHR